MPLRGRKPEIKPADQRRAKVLVFGKPGAGKSRWATEWPGSYYIDTENGAKEKQYQERLIAGGGHYVGMDEGSISLESLIEDVRSLATEPHNFITTCIDSITLPYMDEVARENERLTKEKKDTAYQKDRQTADKMMLRLTRWLLRMDMNVIMTAHAKDEWADGKVSGVTYDGWKKLGHMLDLAIGVVELTNEHRIGTVHKTRLEEFPKGYTFPWSYDVFADLFGRSAIERQSNQIVLAAPERVAELNRLLAIAKPPEEVVEKWLAKEQAETLAEFSAPAVERYIDFIKSKLA